MVEWLQKNSGEKFLSGDPSKDLMDLLVEKTRAAGHMLTFKELSNDPRMFRLYFYSKYFVSFEHATALAWEKAQHSIPVEKSISKPKSVQPVIKEERRNVIVNSTSINLRPQKPLSSKELKGMQNRSKPYTREEIVQAMVSYYQRTGKIPTQSTANPWHNLPSYYTIKKFLGSHEGWKEIILNEINQASILSAKTDTDPETELNSETELEAKFEMQEPVTEPSPEEKSVVQEPILESDTVVKPEIQESVSGPELVTKPEIQESVSGPELVTKPEIQETIPEVIPEDESEPASEFPEPKECSEEIQIENVKVDASCKEKDDEFVTIELKITVPGREKPIVISFTV